MTDASPAAVGGTALIGVVGAGTMGAGIAQVALEHGHEVALYDVDTAATERGRERIRDGLRRRAARASPAKGADAFVEARLAGLRSVTSLEDLAAGADFVIEAALEDLDLKRTIFTTLDSTAAPDVPLATNTSALSVAAIAAATAHPERVLGLHFFNPAPVMRLVEVVVAPRTDPDLAATAADLMTSWDKVPVLVNDAPGFIVNRVNRAFTLEALRMLAGGDASIEAIDAAVEAAGYPLGPFAYMDLVGLDVNLAASIAIYEGLGRPERLRPSELQEALVEADRLGRKRGIGFYRYAVAADGGREIADPLGWPPPRASGAEADAIVERIERAIEAEAAAVVAEGLATAEDVDRALQLGANHPTGSIERARARS